MCERESPQSKHRYMKRERVRRMWQKMAALVDRDVLLFGQILVLMAVVIGLAMWLERVAGRRGGITLLLGARRLTMVAMFAAVSMILMLFELPLPFAPGFYKLDLSELPVLIGAFAFGPAAGAAMEAVKILLKLVVKGSSTAFVGELANFVIGCSFILPASCVYLFRKHHKGAIWACVAGTVSMTVAGSALNAFYLLPVFAAMYGMPLEDILAMGAAVNPLVKDGSMLSFILACVVPLNLFKGLVVSVATFLVYKPLTPILKVGYGIGK